MRVHAEQKDQASKHMVTNICAARETDTAGDFIEKMRRTKNRFEAFPYVYITDEGNRLLGTVSVQEILMSSPNTALKKLMETKLVTARPHTDRERVAMLAIHHKLKAIPVVDGGNILLGVIPENGISEILHEEHVEDMLRSAGVHHAGGSFVNVLKARTSTILKARLPWLALGLVGGIIATFVVQFFESSLTEQIGLAFFVPFILYMGAAVGVQTETIFMRSELLGPVDIKKYATREAKIGLAIGVLIGTVVFLFAYVLFGNFRLALSIGISMFVTILMSILVGLVIPIILLKMKKDPAMGTGPFATVIQDVLSLIIYFSVANLIL